MEESKKWQMSDEDWRILLSYLPGGWGGKAKELHAIDKYRVIKGPEELLRFLMIHLVDGCSLRETAVRIREGFGKKISDVALLKRLNASGEWFRWMSLELMRNWLVMKPPELYGARYRVRIVDGTTIEEPGATGTTWRVHYCIRLPDLMCDEMHVTSPRVGETFCNFRIEAGDLLMGDRVYGVRRAVSHVVDSGGAVIVRINLVNLPVEDDRGAGIVILELLRTLRTGDIGDWDVRFRYNKKIYDGRICGIKKSKEAAELSWRKCLKENRKKGKKVREDTLESTAYVFVFTTVGRDQLSAEHVLELYRGRWQIEMVFKRLKSLLGLGHLRKQDIEGSKAWIQGKLFVSILIEALILAAESFFPWGYPIPE